MMFKKMIFEVSVETLCLDYNIERYNMVLMISEVKLINNVLEFEMTFSDWMLMKPFRFVCVNIVQKIWFSSAHWTL